MDQTPAHELHNPDLLALIPKHAKELIEVGCSSGALAREYKKINGACRYAGVEIESQYAQLAKRHCDTVYLLDIETADERFFEDTVTCDCWIFGDSLEHLRDPWLLLSKIRKVIPSSGHVVACVPNAQHWSVQARLNCGEFRYQTSGLLDKTHLRWFTRITLAETFNAAGFSIVEELPRIFEEPMRERILPMIRAMASSFGADADMAAKDAVPIQYVIRAVPI